MITTKNKTISLNLVGLDGNAFALMGAFSRQARREKWSSEEIQAVLTEAQSGDYNNLLSVLSAYCEPTNTEDDDDDSEDPNK